MQSALATTLRLAAISLNQLATNLTAIPFSSSTIPCRSLSSNTKIDGQELEEPDILFKKLNIEVKSHEPEVLRSYEIFVRQVCSHLDLTCSVETRNSPIFDRLSLNKSPFIYKKHQRQYEFRTYVKNFIIPHVTGCTASVFLEYIQRNLPAGVHMAVTHESVYLDHPNNRTRGVGKAFGVWALGSLPGALMMFGVLDREVETKQILFDSIDEPNEVSI